MSTITQPRPVGTGTGDDDPHHVYCCDPDMALCGENVSGEPDAGEVTGDELLCPMCEVLLDWACPRCGE